VQHPWAHVDPLSCRCSLVSDYGSLTMRPPMAADGRGLLRLLYVTHFPRVLHLPPSCARLPRSSGFLASGVKFTNPYGASRASLTSVSLSSLFFIDRRAPSLSCTCFFTFIYPPVFFSRGNVLGSVQPSVVSLPFWNLIALSLRSLLIIKRTSSAVRRD